MRLQIGRYGLVERGCEMRSILYWAIVPAMLFAAGPGWTKSVDLRTQWNDRIPLDNPDKGWYHHFPDNHINKYVIQDDSDLTQFPGMDHLYIRLAWAYLEPDEGRYDWDVIDSLIEKWTGKGLGIAFRISCKETGTDRIEQQFATPKWVMQAGAKGGFYRNGRQVGPDGPWEPVFDDPVFLEKLENFLEAFAERYDGKPWLRYVDIGSIGDWGEGHTWSGSRKKYDFQQRKTHVDLYLKYFRKSQIVVTDDFVYGIEDEQQRLKMHEYIVDNGITYRDDSILVNYYVGAFAQTWTVRSPEFFEAVWRKRPTILELEHYGTVKRLGNWEAEADSLMAEHGAGRTGADFFRGALELLHATYIGYHGYAHEWLAGNPQLTTELLNRCGYWYFPQEVTLPETLQAGEQQHIRISWLNRGVAPGYRRYNLVFRLTGPDLERVEVDSRNNRWLPSEQVYPEDYYVRTRESLRAGRYKLAFKLRCPKTNRDVLLPLNAAIKDKDNFYHLTEIDVNAPAKP